MAWSGPIDLRFEQGLLEVCSGFVHMKTPHARVLAANVLFSSLFPLG